MAECGRGCVIARPASGWFCATQVNLTMPYGGHDPGACALYMGAQAHWSLGYPDTGLAIGREALALAERIAHLSEMC
jgi:hypothetical protein